MAAITDNECRRLKLLHILETAGQRVLRYTLHSGMSGKPSTVTLLQYLDNLPQDSTANYTKVKNKSKCFSKTDKDQINGDPTCASFDVTLLYKAIKLACENVADPNETVHNINVWASPTPLCSRELEHFTTKIKNTRNDVVHEGQPLNETDFLNEVTKLRALFDSCLRATKSRYARDDAEHLTERAVMQAKVTDIQQETLGIAEMLQRSAASMLPDFKQETENDLRTRLDNARYLTPLHFLSGIPEDRVKVDDIFCDITLAEDRGTALTGNVHKVPSLEVLRLCEGVTASVSVGAGTSAGAARLGQAQPQALVVEGEAGSGKTTLVCFLVQQWLMPQDRRRVQGLDRYELLLRVVCRERSSPTFEGLLQQLLPESYVKYRRLLLPLLKQCRVLVVIDGIDEMNDVSHPLVTNILSEAAATAFTVVCTSRPYRVQDLKTEARHMHFQVSHVKMLGVSDDTQRMELVVRHYQWLRAGANTATDTDALRQAVRGIVQRQVFSLPLNLLFLATVFHFEPNRVSKSLSQGDLYKYIHMWCTEKLVGKVSKFLQDSVDRVLSVIYEVALKGLLKDRVYLNEQDLKMVKEACKPDLDPHVVLSAYYSTRREVTTGVVKETYMAPHKSLQEFMAAKGIAGQVLQYSEGAIERVLRVHTAGQDPPLDKLQDTLVHLLSLLTRQDDARNETVELLRQSGVKSIFQWLYLLTSAMAPDAVVQHAAEQLVAGGLHDNKEITVTDDLVHTASVMLQHLPRQKVVVYLYRELADVDSLVRGLAHHEVTKLILFQHWWQPQQYATSASLLRVVQGSDLREFEGHLNAEDLALLPRGLRVLFLGVRDSHHAQTLTPALAEACHSSLPRLEALVLNISVATVTPTALTRLPACPYLRFTLCLSGVTNLLVESAADIVAAVCPRELACTTSSYRVSRLEFHGATLDLRGWEELFSRLQQAGLRVWHRVYVPLTHLTDDEKRQLKTLATTMLSCEEVLEC